MPAIDSHGHCGELDNAYDGLSANACAADDAKRYVNRHGPGRLNA